MNAHMIAKLRDAAEEFRIDPAEAPEVAVNAFGQTSTGVVLAVEDQEVVLGDRRGRTTTILNLAYVASVA